MTSIMVSNAYVPETSDYLLGKVKELASYKDAISNILTDITFAADTAANRKPNAFLDE